MYLAAGSESYPWCRVLGNIAIAEAYVQMVVVLLSMFSDNYMATAASDLTRSS